MAEMQEIVQVRNTNHYRNGTASVAEPSSGARNSKSFAWFKALFRSCQSRAPSPPEATERSALPSSCVRSSARIERMIESRSEFATELEFEIASSRVHWSELESTSIVQQAGHSRASGEEDDAAHETNTEIVESLRRQWPKSRGFFEDHGDRLEVGAKIAEGAQAEIFEARLYEMDCVLKVFKEGFSLRDLQRQWPRGMLKRTERLGSYVTGNCSWIGSGSVVMNGRFAFVMERAWGDLRKLIDLRMQRNNQRPPFSDVALEWNMLGIATGMRELHKDNIIHRDLKASNVLTTILGEDSEENSDLVHSSGPFFCEVADYECSVGVVGTGFWRAPEILQVVKDRNITPDLFTRASDVYSFAMTCYEMITGRLPFEDVRLNDYDVVLVRGERPILPDDTKLWIQTLLSRCWHLNPRKRPSFESIVKGTEWKVFNRYSPLLRRQNKVDFGIQILEKDLASRVSSKSSNGKFLIDIAHCFIDKTN